MSAERDEEVFQSVTMCLEARKVPLDLVRELLSIARKWRSKGLMRETRIAQFEQELLDLRNHPE